MNEIPLSRVGLLTVPETAEQLGRSIRGVQKLIADGRIPVVIAGTGRRIVYLIRAVDVKKFTPPPRGRPVSQPP